MDRAACPPFPRYAIDSENHAPLRNVPFIADRAMPISADIYSYAFGQPWLLPALQTMIVDHAGDHPALLAAWPDLASTYTVMIWIQQ